MKADACLWSILHSVSAPLMHLSGESSESSHIDVPLLLSCQLLTDTHTGTHTPRTAEGRPSTKVKNRKLDDIVRFADVSSDRWSKQFPPPQMQGPGCGESWDAGNTHANYRGEKCRVSPFSDLHTSPFDSALFVHNVPHLTPR